MALLKRELHDVLVVGSGASGGWVAKEAAERGLSVVMLEAGPPRIATRDFTEHISPYQLKFRGFGNQQQLLRTQPVQRLCYACVFAASLLRHGRIHYPTVHPEFAWSSLDS
jgi:choline dehydrogenase-like flavoprotein